MKYKELLNKHCTGIAQDILNEMKSNRVKVGDIKPAIVPKEPILYRWWFPAKSIVVQKLCSLAASNKELKKLLHEVETQEIDGETYMALYFGKSNKGYCRFIQHSTGNVHTSTLRHIIYGLYVGRPYDKTKELDISKILDACYFEWLSFPEEGELIECLEGICIATGKYPLNIEGNPNIDKFWREEIMSIRNIY